MFLGKTKHPFPLPTWPPGAAARAAPIYLSSKHDCALILLSRAPGRNFPKASHLSRNPSLLSDSNLNPQGCGPSPFPLAQSPAGGRQQLAFILLGINCTRNYQPLQHRHLGHGGTLGAVGVLSASMALESVSTHWSSKPQPETSLISGQDARGGVLPSSAYPSISARRPHQLHPERSQAYGTKDYPQVV